MESIISTFHIDWKIILAQAFNFAVVFVVLYIFALKPLSKLMAERSEKIKQGIDDAKSNAVILEKTKLESDAMLQKARAEANAIFQGGKKEAEAEKIKLLEEARSEVTKIIASGRNTLEADKAKMVEETKNEIAGLAMLATEKILAKKPMDELKSL